MRVALFEVGMFIVFVEVGRDHRKQNEYAVCINVRSYFLFDFELSASCNRHFWSFIAIKYCLQGLTAFYVNYSNS